MSTSNIQSGNKNAFLKWLSTPEISPPFPIDPKAFLEAWTTVSTAYTTAVRKLKKTPSIQTFRQWQKKDNSLTLLSYWFSFVGVYVDAPQVKAMEKLRAKVEKDSNNRVKNARVLKDFLSKFSYRKSLSSAEKEEVRAVRDTLVKPSKDILDRVEPIISKKEDSFYKNHEGLHFQTAHRLTGMNSSNLEYSRFIAATEGQNGLSIKKSVSLLNDMMESCHNRGVREELWRMRQESPFSDSDANRLLSARHDVALERGYDNYASHELSERIHKNPKSLLNVFENHLLQMAPVHNQLMELLAYFGKKELGIEKMEDWDVSFLIDQLDLNLYGNFPNHLFPCVRTLEVVVSELVAITGWQVEFMTIIGEDANQMFQWRLTRDGQYHDLWIAPFKSTSQPFIADCGNATFLRVGKSQKMHSVIQLFGNHKQGNFDLEGLSTLVHEVGHYMHWLSIPVKEATKDITGSEDLREVPAILLENMVYDPKVLERWSAEKRSAKFWNKAAHSRDVRKFYNAFFAALSAYVDLKINTDKPDDVREFCDSLADKFGFDAFDKDSNRLFEYSMWLGYGASDYMYHLAHSVNSFIHPNLLTTPNAQKIARLYRKMEATTLVKSTMSLEVQHQAWKELSGTSLLSACRQGGMSQKRSIEIALQKIVDKVVK